MRKTSKKMEKGWLGKLIVQLKLCINKLIHWRNLKTDMCIYHLFECYNYSCTRKFHCQRAPLS